MLIMERPFATGPKRGDMEGKAHAVLSQKHPAAFPSLVTDAAVRTANLFELPDEHRDPPSYSAAMPKAGVMASRPHRNSVESGKSVSVRVGPGGRRII